MKNIQGKCVLAYLCFVAPCFSNDNISQIKVIGTVHVAACEVDVNSKNLPVDMGKYNTSIFHSVGDATDPVSFGITLTDCPETTNSALIKLDGTADSTNSQLIAIDDSDSSAQGIGIAVYDASGIILPLWTPSSHYNLQKGTNTLLFTARYVASSIPVSEGVANATVDFTLNYL